MGDKEDLKEFRLLWCDVTGAESGTHDMLHKHDIVELDRCVKSEKDRVARRTTNVELEFLTCPWNQIPYHLEKSLVTRPFRRGGIGRQG